MGSRIEHDMAEIRTSLQERTRLKPLQKIGEIISYIYKHTMVHEMDVGRIRIVGDNVIAWDITYKQFRGWRDKIDEIMTGGHIKITSNKVSIYSSEPHDRCSKCHAVVRLLYHGICPECYTAIL